MPKPFDPLWERLLRGGVKRSHARRYLAELHDHLDDLTAEERQAGGGPEDARRRALVRLGSPEVLADAMITQRLFRAWSRRLPVTTYLIAPSLVLAFAMGLAIAALVMTCIGLRSSGGDRAALPLWSAPLLAGMIFFSNAMISVLVGWTLAGLALRRRSPPSWPVVGMVVLASVGAALQVGVTLPTAVRHGEITLAPGLGPSFFHSARYVRHLTVNLALTLLPYVGLRRWQAIRASPINEEGSRGWPL